MTSNYLFPHRFRVVSSLLFITSFIALAISVMTEWCPEVFEINVLSLYGDSNILGNDSHQFVIENNIFDELLTTVAIISGLIWAFSKEKMEDELISTVRKDALTLAVFINYGLYLLATFFVYGISFLQVLMLNVFTTLIFFIIIYNSKKYQLKKSSHEE